MHLVGASVLTGRGQQKLLAQRPEAQQADAELALQSPHALRFQASLDRVAHVRGDIVEIRRAVRIPAHAFAIVLHAEVMLALLFAAGDDDRLGACIDAVFDQFGHRLERIALRQGDDRDRFPVIADAQVPAVVRFADCLGPLRHAALTTFRRHLRPLGLMYVSYGTKVTYMEKIQVYLPKEELDALRKAAARSGRSVAELVREAIRKVILKTPAAGPVAIWDGEPRRPSIEHDTVHDEP